MQKSSVTRGLLCIYIARRGNFMKAKVAICSSVGRRRNINQDNFFVNGFINKESKSNISRSFFRSGKEQILCVFDGMGGENDGEIAALIAAQKLCSYCGKYSDLTDKIRRHIQSYTSSANRAICEYIDASEGKNMGSTLAFVCISPKEKVAFVANVGDSKVFLLRSGVLTKLTVDHNEAQRLVDLGMITEEEARTHKGKSKLTQHLGIHPEEMVIEPEISEEIPIQKGDVFLVCSDGLTDVMNYNEIIQVLSLKLSTKRKCKRIIQTSNGNGGVDNITAIICEII